MYICHRLLTIHLLFFSVRIICNVSMAESSTALERSMSVVSTQTLPRLSTAQQQTNPLTDVNKDYRSGANYQGQIDGNQKFGHGVFTWPSGASYEGEFADNCRHGKGKSFHTH